MKKGIKTFLHVLGLLIVFGTHVWLLAQGNGMDKAAAMWHSIINLVAVFVIVISMVV